MTSLGFVRVAVAVPRVHVADPAKNVDEALALLTQSAAESCQLALFPELSLTGYTCGDLFHQATLIRAAESACLRLLRESAERYRGLFVFGMPIEVEGRLYNCAAVAQAGRLLGLVPKRHLPNYKEFYEHRWFLPGPSAEYQFVSLGGQTVELSTRQMFVARQDPRVKLGIEICEDLWIPSPPSAFMALRGATILLNLSASNESTGKADYRRQLVVMQSARCNSAYLYAAAGVTESTTDLVFGGHGMIAEDGELLAEAARFRRAPQLLIADVDIDRLIADRQRMHTFWEARTPGNGLNTADDHEFDLVPRNPPLPLRRRVAAHPFVPAQSDRLAARCEEIFASQTAGLAKRLEMLGGQPVHIGISGGLDSTLALLVAVKTCDLLGWERMLIHGLTMPGFGTSSRTQSNAASLLELLGIPFTSLDIRPMCLAVFVSLGHAPFGIDPNGLTVADFVVKLQQVPEGRRQDLVFENVQARVRTLLLMSRGFVIGTGDLSELALGWATYNADHMSMYNPNVSIPKTLVRFLVRWAAQHEFDGAIRTVLESIADTEISPELLPLGPDDRLQSTERTIGPYELHDFFIFYTLRYGYAPRKILQLAEHAKFDNHYDSAALRHWLRVFYQRFFANQFKRSCLPDGPKVGSVSLSPRGDWRMPSDADAARWLAELDAPPAVGAH